MARLRLCSLLVVLALWPGLVWAECSLIGTLVRVDVLDGSRKDTHSLYLREFKTDPHYYVFETSNQTLALGAAALVALQTRVEVVGDETGCLASGQARFAGDVRRLTVVP